jgi:pimeloyl-ACP methyl ester carboxylesterase
VITPEEWHARGTEWTWRGHRIFVRIEGRGEPLLLIHGFPTASWDFAPLWSALTARFRVVTADMIGFGFSAKPPGFPYSIFAQADLQEALLEREGIRRYRILAHDYGLTVAQELLARHDHGIERVVLLNGGLFPEQHRPVLTQRLLASRITGPLVARLSSYRTFARTMRGIWGAVPPREDELRAMWSLVTTGNGTSVMPRLIGYMAERRRHRERWVGALVRAAAAIPIRLVDGLDDPISGAHMVARYRELVPRPDVVELSHIGHYPQLEAPDRVLDAALAVL